MFYRDENSSLVLHIFWNSLFIGFFLLPLDINLPTPFFMLSIVLGIVNIFQSPRNFISDNRPLLLFPLYFVVMCLSLIYTDNLSDGWALIQRSLTLLLFPVIFLFVKEDVLTVRKLFSFLLMGLVVSFYINFAWAANDAWLVVKNSTPDESSLRQVQLFFSSFHDGWDYFMGSQFSRLISPSYVSLYILLVLSYYLKKPLETGLQFFILIVLFLYLFLLASRAAYLILAIMSLMLIFNISDTGKRYTMFIVFILGLIVFLKHPRIFESTNPGEYNATITEKARLKVWDSGLEVVLSQPLFGYGVGDANDVLIEKYKELGYQENYENRYNAHNQFLQTWMQMGIPGLAIMISIFVILASRMRRSSNEFSVFLILFISLFFESMLVRFNGIVFLSIIIPLLLKKRSILSSRIIRNE
ncbi:O-antigen ligase family protein [Galbibacter sp. EGI 63066]|uniref:O-antigen ligase family protein n=1 Tax=Galbibacter sp. EGI 63066 TaxID=2993559 RepID=UPI0022487FC2|nr:O-antigen ligase family protein [Galbibacter sp. EGI 63066]MCX2680699.1 O-antigen ligase family protein [Galbibacter sp. EGI 63066]